MNKLTNELLKFPTGYGSNGFFDLTRKALTTKTTSMAGHEKELERVLDELKELDKPVNKTTWDEVTDAWLLVYDNYEKLEGARARILIEQVFASKSIRKKVGAAKQLHNIALPDQPPDGVLVLLKEAKAELKKNMTDYIKAANAEIAKIQRIRDHQAKLVGWISLFFVTVGTSLGGIFSHWVNDRYLLKEGKSSDPPLNGDRTQESFTQERRLGIMTVVEVSSFPCAVLSFLLVALVLKTVWRGRKTRVATAGFTRLGKPTLRLVAMFLLIEC